MTNFLSTILTGLLKDYSDLSVLTFILPSKRAGAFLKKEISQQVGKPVFSPTILSIEEFAEDISGLSSIDNTTSLFEFYSVYREQTPAEETEDFENFSTWAQTLIHDFNEIDRFLIDPDRIFNYLAEIQDINHWSSTPEKTGLVKNYLAFWKKLPEYYKGLKNNLLKKEQGYQGLIYRLAAEKIEAFAAAQNSPHIFIGFNALNNAEQHIIQSMLKFKAQVFWDIDEVHFKDTEHDAGIFMRHYAQNWPHYATEKFNTISASYNTPKDIEVIGIPKNIGQAKYVGEILDTIPPGKLNTTALVLGEESLLLPVINSLPPGINALNITMGYPLKYSPFSYLFEIFFEFCQAGEGNYYYKDVINVLSNPIIQRISNECEQVIGTIRNENLLYLTQSQIKGLFKKNAPGFINFIFPEDKIDPKQTVALLKQSILEIKTHLNEEGDALNLEFLHKYHLIALQLEELLVNYPHIKTLNSLHTFYREISGQQALDFQGKPFEGLQVMGMLESRVLDFETVILTSLNEGILPAGKTNNSFIPYELKKTFGLPTYKEKDAVYTYHFYHLLQRAKKVYLLHNTDTESQMGGEKSRFLIQLEIEKQSNHNIKDLTITPRVITTTPQLQKVEKTPEIIEKIKLLAGKGFSPSALTTYIRNPLDFYRQYILNIRDKEEVEETVAYNTLGTVVHDTLESFYAPLQGRELTIHDVKGFQSRISTEVKKRFEETYSKVPIKKGKNLLIFEVAKRYVSNFLKLELKQLEEGHQIFIKHIEANLAAPIAIPHLDFPVSIRGKVDRVDQTGKVLRIIDYKTGKVLQNQLEICEWDLLASDYDKYSKPFQVLTYTLMLLENNPTTAQVEAGVISFKNLKQGFLKFGEKENSRAKIKNCTVDDATLEKFKVQLKNLILEICDPKIPFLEKEIKKAYGNY